MRSEREQEFFSAIEVIQKALREGVVMQGWDKKEPVSMVMIHRGSFGPGFVLQDIDDRHAGWEINASINLSIVDKAEVARRERDAAQKVLDEAVRKGASLNKEIEDAHARVQEANRKLVELGAK